MLAKATRVLKSFSSLSGGAYIMDPAVFDTLNIGPQMEHQLKSFGAPSDMIK